MPLKTFGLIITVKTFSIYVKYCACFPFVFDELIALQ